MKIKKVTAFLLAGTIAASLALSGCGTGVNQSATVATLGEQEISLGYANFVAHYTQATYDSMFASYYGEDYWTNESFVDEDGKTMEDMVKEGILEDIETAYQLEAHMADYGVEITEEEQAAIKAAAEEFMSENSAKALKTMGATQEYVEDMLYYETVKSKMRAAIEATADTTVTDEECARRTFSYIKIDLAGHTDENGTYVEYTEDERSAIEDMVPLIGTMAKNDFQAAAESYSYSVSTYSYGKDEASEEDGGFASAVIDAADHMSEGQVSDVITGSEDTRYIIRLDSENDENAAATAKEDIITKRKNDKYTEVLDGYKEETEFVLNEEQWKKVKFSGIFTMGKDEEPSDDTSAPAE